MTPDAYRILVSYDSKREKFVAHVPELGNVCAQGETRVEALSKVEECIEGVIRKAAENSSEIPLPLDCIEFSGEVNVRISKGLHRELTFLAKHEGIELDKLISELLCAGVVSRLGIRGQFRERVEKSRRSENKGKRLRTHDYFNIMDDRASFIEYVRNTEQGQPWERGGRGRGHR